MSIKNQVLLLLEQNKHTPLSGEELAKRLGCTRAGIWKAVKSLINEGYDVEAVNNKGYTLRESADVLSEAYIEEKLKAAGINITVKCEKCVDSTNNVLKAMASEGYADDYVLISEEQTAGKGRRGRSFYSPKGTGLYLSFLLHPEIPVIEAQGLTTMAVTAEALAIEKVTGVDVFIKWVNDLFFKGKKVSGILTEASTSIEDGSLEYAVPGIGINLYEPEGGFPDEIKDIAGAVFENNIKVENLKNNLAAELIIQFMKYYNAQFIEKTGNAYIEDYKKRCFVVGKDIEILTPDHEALNVKAHVLDIDDNCHLHVKYEDGREEYLSSGEISVHVL